MIIAMCNDFFRLKCVRNGLPSYWNRHDPRFDQGAGASGKNKAQHDIRFPGKIRLRIEWKRKRSFHLAQILWRLPAIGARQALKARPARRSTEKAAAPQRRGPKTPTWQRHQPGSKFLGVCYSRRLRVSLSYPALPGGSQQELEPVSIAIAGLSARCPSN